MRASENRLENAKISGEHEALPAGEELVNHHDELTRRGQGFSMIHRMMNASQSRRSTAKKSWLIIYISLFSGLLAFFLLSALLIELEFSDDKRLYQKVVKQLYNQSQVYKGDYQLDWLNIDNTLNHGVRLTIDPKLSHSVNQEILQFASAQAQIHPDFVPYLLQVTGLIQDLKLQSDHPTRHQLMEKLHAQGKTLVMQIRVAGHTDSNPMAPNARFKDNVELSSFRAFAVMRYLQTHSMLPRTQFSIAGYGEFQPTMNDSRSPENRRIEIYITPMIKPLDMLATHKEVSL